MDLDKMEDLNSQTANLLTMVEILKERIEEQEARLNNLEKEIYD